MDKGFSPYELGLHSRIIHPDHLGTPQKMTDSSGTVVWAADYKPFGEATITVSTITNNLRFPGQYYDAETGLHYNYYRNHNPAIGRYIEADPLALAGGINPFIYVTNSPLNFADPQGLYPEPPNFNIDIPAVLRDLRYFRHTSPESCGKCERKAVIMVKNGWAEYAAVPEDNPAFSAHINTHILYGQEVIERCIPKCCVEKKDVASVRSSGTLFHVPAWKMVLLTMWGYTFNIETLYSKFDCSSCNNPCKKCS